MMSNEDWALALGAFMLLGLMMWSLLFGWGY